MVGKTIACASLSAALVTFSWFIFSAAFSLQEVKTTRLAIVSVKNNFFIILDFEYYTD
jgi:hypothetical protein